MPQYQRTRPLSPEESAEIHRKLQRTLIRNVLIFAVVKGAIYYGMNRWAKSLQNQV